MPHAALLVREVHIPQFPAALHGQRGNPLEAAHNTLVTPGVEMVSHGVSTTLWW